MVTDAEFLNWIADRFVHVIGESENVDFVQRLRKIAASPAPAGLDVVYVVKFSNYDPAEIDSIWTVKADAEARAAELGGAWYAAEWPVSRAATRPADDK